MIYKLAVTYETARMLKEAGFHELVLFFYDADVRYANLRRPEFIEYRYRDFNAKQEREAVCSAPTQEEVLDWLRDFFSIHVRVRHSFVGDMNNTVMYSWEVERTSPNPIDAYCDVTRYDDYHKCQEEAIQFAIKRWLNK